MDKKICTRCKELKDFSKFGVDKKLKLGLKHWCKKCYTEIAKERYNTKKDEILKKDKIRRDTPDAIQKRKDYHLKNKERLAAQRKEYREKNKEWLLENARKRREENRDEINKRCRERRNTPEGKLKQKEKDRIQREKHRDKKKEYQILYREKNSDKIKNRKKQKRIENPEYAQKLRFDSYARSRGFKDYAELLIDRESRKKKTVTSQKEYFKMQFADIIEFQEAWKILQKEFYRIDQNEKTKIKRLEDANYRLADCMRARVRKALKHQSAQKRKPTMDLVGCTGLELSIYLDNLNYNKETDHIDHIVAISRFDLTNHDHQLIACHYLNLQPLHYKDNCSKHDSLPENWQEVIYRICEVRNINPQPIINHIKETVKC